MSFQSITNKLVANIKQTSSSDITTITNEKVVCIDSSNNRIGINTLNPSDSITISGNNLNNAVRAPYLYITNSGNINEISSNFLYTTDASINDLSFETCDFSFIKGNKANIRNLDVSSFNIEPNILTIGEINSTNIVTDILNVNSEITCKEVTSDKYNFAKELNVTKIDMSNLKVSISGEINHLICNDISVNDISVINISCDILNVSDNLDVSLISTKSINIDTNLNASNAQASFLGITTQDISINSISSLNLNNYIANQVNNLFIDSQSAIFNDLSINSSLNMINDAKVNMNPTTEISNGNYIPTSLIIPNKLIIPNNSNTNQNNKNYIYFDNNNVLHIKDQSIPFTNNIVYFNCANDVSGQRKQDFQPSINSYDIFFYNNLSINNPFTGNVNLQNYKFKYIPISINDSTSSTIFTEEDVSKSYLKIESNSNNKFDLQATISLQFFNRIANDVEVNNYIFGVFDSNNNTIYTSIKNSIMVFDNSFNYANSNINYYGSFKNSNPKLQFFVGSHKDNSFIYVDSLSATIRF